MISTEFSVPSLRISDYTYILPEDRVAKYPLPERDASKLLVYRQPAQGGRPDIRDDVFVNLPRILPADSLLVFNNTKVVPARLFFTKETGAHIEVFCLEPASPKEYILAFSQHASSVWYCAVGNAKKWKSGALPLYNPKNDPGIASLGLSATMIDKEGDRYLVRFRWSPDVPFSRVLELSGKVPIPPYLKREAEEADIERYQTVYARNRGSVAAPTAGLHFSSRVIGELLERQMKIQELTLHVGAGTFRPVKSHYIRDHVMHCEPFSVPVSFLESLRDHVGPLVSVGTTSCRCLESLYYLGLQSISGKDPSFVGQWEPYFTSSEVSYKESLDALIGYLKRNRIETLEASTQILIIPSYRFRGTDILITNYHQPNSTLLLLIAAFTGDDWRLIYDHALMNNYRFLSYGDSSVLFSSKYCK